MGFAIWRRSECARPVHYSRWRSTHSGRRTAGGRAFDRAFAQIWRPLAFEPQNMTRNFHWFGAFARLKPGVTLKQATAQMDAIGARIAQEYPDSNKGWG